MSVPSILDRMGTALDEEIIEQPEIIDEEVQESEEGQATDPENADQVESPTEAEALDEDEPSHEVSSLSDLAEHLGVDVADLYNVTVPVTMADGSRKEVSIGEWKDSFREHEILRSEKQKFEQQMGRVQQEIAQKAQTLDAAYVQADQMIKIAERQLLGEIDGPEMMQLRATNPAEYAAKKQEYRDGLEKLHGIRQQAIVGYQQQMQEQRQKMEGQRQAYLQNQAAMIPQLIPEWKDDRVMEAERSELSSYLVSAGIPKEQVETVDNAAIVAIARKAMLWDKQQHSKPEVKKKTLSIGGKVLKSGKAPTKTERKADERVRARVAIKKAPSSRDSEKAAQAYIEKYLLGE